MLKNKTIFKFRFSFIATMNGKGGDTRLTYYPMWAQSDCTDNFACLSHDSEYRYNSPVSKRRHYISKYITSASISCIYRGSPRVGMHTPPPTLPNHFIINAWFWHTLCLLVFTLQTYDDDPDLWIPTAAITVEDAELMQRYQDDGKKRSSNWTVTSFVEIHNTIIQTKCGNLLPCVIEQNVVKSLRHIRQLLFIYVTMSRDPSCEKILIPVLGKFDTRRSDFLCQLKT